jgi:carboxymethylenebutenolidase
MATPHDGGAVMESTGLTRRQALVAGAATFAGYAVGVDKALAQAIKTDTDGLVAGDQTVPIGSYNMPVYEARPATGTGHPIVIAISEVWGVHEWVKDVTRRFAKAGYCCVAPELFQREGGVGHIANVQDILKIVFALQRKQALGDVAAAADWAKTRPGARADKIGITGWCWGGSVVYHAAATNPDIKAAVSWYGQLTRPFPDSPNPVTGLDVAKDLKVPFLGLYGETDQNPKPDDVGKFIEILKPHNPTAEAVIYPGAGHAFFADYRPSYNAVAAADGWKRCTAFFDKLLKA